MNNFMIELYKKKNDWYHNKLLQESFVSMKKNILIIKHGSLGDLVLATGAIQAIKNHFSDHNIYILTSSKYKKFIEQAPFVTNVICDDRKSFFNIINNFLLFKKIIGMKFSYIIDLQNSTRTSIYNFIYAYIRRLPLFLKIFSFFLCSIAYYNTTNF